MELSQEIINGKQIQLVSKNDNICARAIINIETSQSFRQ